MNVLIDGTLKLENGKIELDDGLTGTGTLDLAGNGVIVADCDVDISGLTLTAGDGAVRFDSASDHTLTALSSQDLPNVEQTGAGKTTITLSGGTTLSMRGLNVAAGQFDIGDYTPLIDNLSVNGGIFNARGKTFTSDAVSFSTTVQNIDNTTFNTTDFQLDGAAGATSAWNVNSGNKGLAVNTTIAYCDASDGQQLRAVSCTDGDNNDNVSFEGLPRSAYIQPADLYIAQRRRHKELEYCVWQCLSVDYDHAIVELNIDGTGWRPVLSSGQLGVAGSGNDSTTRYAVINPSNGAGSKLSFRGLTVRNLSLVNGSTIQARVRPLSFTKVILADWNTSTQLTMTEAIKTLVIVSYKPSNS